MIDVETIKLLLQIFTSVAAVGVAVAYFRLEVRTMRENIHDNTQHFVAPLLENGRRIDELTHRIEELSNRVEYLRGSLGLNGRPNRANVVPK